MQALSIRSSVYLTLVVGIATWSCSVQAGLEDELPPEAYLDPIDQQIARTGTGLPGRPFPCARQESDEGFEIIRSVPTDQCVKMLPAQQYQGFWRNEFEGSRLCLAPASECSFYSEGEKIWLTFAEGAAAYEPADFGGLYEIEIMGRRTSYKGPYGHLAGSDHELIVDRVISIREIEPPPPPPTPAEQEAWWKACEAAGRCMSHGDLEKMREEPQ